MSDISQLTCPRYVGQPRKKSGTPQRGAHKLTLNMQGVLTNSYYNIINTYLIRHTLPYYTTADKFPRGLCDPIPPVILFYHVSLQPTSGNIKQQSQGVGGHRVYVGIRHPLCSMAEYFYMYFFCCAIFDESKYKQ